MRRPARIAAVVLLLIAAVSYFLPWLFWESDARMEFSDRMKKALAGLPSEFQPRTQYEVRVSRSPFGEVAENWDVCTPERYQDDEITDPTGFGLALPVIRLGPRTSLVTRWAFAGSGLLVLLALVCSLRGCRRSEQLGAVFAAGALIAAITALLFVPDLSKYLQSTADTRTVEMPGQWTAHYTLRFGATPWFWVGITSLLTGTLAACYAAIARDQPVSSLDSTEHAAISEYSQSSSANISAN